MKFLLPLLFCFSIATAQTKKINMFGNEFSVNNKCEVKETSIQYDKNAMIWTDAPPKLMRGTMMSMIKNKLAGKRLKEVKSEVLKVSLLNSKWEGKMSLYKKADSDTVINFIQLYGDYNDQERLLIIVYKTLKLEPFRVPAYFDFLVK